MASETNSGWLEHMRRGDFNGAWNISDKLLSTAGAIHDARLPRHRQRVWNGAPLAGRTVLVRCYHGLGDTIQFIRYAPLLNAIGARPIFWAQPELIPLLRNADGVQHLEPLTDGIPRAPFDIDVELQELPHVFRTSVDTIPASIPYIHVDAEPGFATRRLDVALVWQAGDWDGRRSIPLNLLEPLAGLHGVCLHAFQRGPALENAPSWLQNVAGSDDVLEAARILKAMDLLLTVDSMPAHLGGATGVKTWLLLHSDPDWRWMTGRQDSPWYPGMRLFRQQRAGDWRSVIHNVATELQAMTSHSASV